MFGNDRMMEQIMHQANTNEVKAVLQADVGNKEINTTIKKLIKFEGNLITLVSVQKR